MSKIDIARRRAALAMLLAQQMAQESADADKYIKELCRINEGTIDFSKTEISVKAKPPLFVLQVWAEAAMGFLDEADAPNFREMHFTFNDPNGGQFDPPIVVTVQRPGGKSPAIVAREARDRAEKAEAEVARLLPLCIRSVECCEACGPMDNTLRKLSSEVIDLKAECDQLRNETAELKRKLGQTQYELYVLQRDTKLEADKKIAEATNG